MSGSSAPDAIADLELSDRAALVGDSLVLADLHLGQGAASRIELPVGAGTEMVERIETLLERFEPARLVLGGDLLHSFSTVPHTVQAALDGIVEAARTLGVEVVVLEGNHDTMLESVWDGEVRDEVRIDGTVVCHGHVAPELEAERYLVGHDHPTLAVEGTRRPCYLAGDGVYRDADLVVLPAFSRLLRGVAVNDVRARDFQSPLVRDADALAPIVWDDDARETLVFPPLGQFRHRL